MRGELEELLEVGVGLGLEVLAQAGQTVLDARLGRAVANELQLLDLAVDKLHVALHLGQVALHLLEFAAQPDFEGVLAQFRVLMKLRLDLLVDADPEQEVADHFVRRREFR